MVLKLSFCYWMLFHPLIPWDFHSICIHGYMQCCYTMYDDDDDDLHRRELRYENFTSMCFCSMLKGTFIEIFIHSLMFRSKVDFWINRKCFFDSTTPTDVCLLFSVIFSQSIWKFPFKKGTRKIMREYNKNITVNRDWEKGLRHNII